MSFAQFAADARTQAAVLWSLSIIDNHQGRRTGGVIWHTTGSGKALTMVMLAKAPALHPTIPDPRIILVTDRVDLDDQLAKTFLACGKKVHRITSSGDLVAALRAGKFDIFTTVINKLNAAAGQGFRAGEVSRDAGGVNEFADVRGCAAAPA